jgi:hypothetical protein
MTRPGLLAPEPFARFRLPQTVALTGDGLSTLPMSAIMSPRR